MRLSAPIYHLKRQARLLSRKEEIPLHAALDRVASSEGFAGWSLLAARLSRQGPAAKLHLQLAPGDMVVVAARPGHGKTLMSLELAVEAMRAGNRAVFFSLEYVEADIAGRFDAIGVDPRALEGLFTFDNSDTIDAGHIIKALAGAKPGTLAVIDYLQLLDQRRENPPLGEQMRALKAFAGESGVIFVAISQVDRRYDAAAKPCPDMTDIRLPNPVDLTFFTKACFLHAGAVQVHSLA